MMGVTEVPTRAWHCPSLSHRPHVDGCLVAHMVRGVPWTCGDVRGSVCLQLNWRDGTPCRPGECPGGRAANSVLKAGLSAVQECARPDPRRHSSRACPWPSSSAAGPSGRSSRSGPCAPTGPGKNRAETRSEVDTGRVRRTEARSSGTHVPRWPGRSVARAPRTLWR